MKSNWIGTENDQADIAPVEYAIFSFFPPNMEMVRVTYDHNACVVNVDSLDSTDTHDGCWRDEIAEFKTDFQRFPSQESQSVLKEIYQMRTKHGI